MNAIIDFVKHPHGSTLRKYIIILQIFILTGCYPVGHGNHTSEQHQRIMQRMNEPDGQFYQEP